MVISEGYSIMQEVKKNRIVINLPQTVISLTSTSVPMSGRRTCITGDEEAVLLHIVKAMYEGKIVREEGNESKTDDTYRE